MSGSARASPGRDAASPAGKAQPSLPPGDSSEETLDYVNRPVGRKPAIDSLLPPGADEEPAPPPLVGSGPMLAEFMAPSVGPRSTAELQPPVIEMDTAGAVGQAISPEKKAQRRFWRNAIVFGVCLIVLMAVCFLLAR
jgi:hypothetical protein